MFMKKRDDIIELANRFEAERFEAIMEQEGIPCSIISRHSTVYDGIFQLQEGWGFAEISPEYREKAEELLNEYRNSRERE